MSRIIKPFLLAIICLSFMRCAKPREFSVLIKMIPVQEEDFRKKVIPPFESANNCKITVLTFEDMWNIEDKLKEAKADATIPPVGLVKTPFEMTKVLVGRGLIRDINSIIAKADFDKIKEEYFLLDLTTYAGKTYYIPRKFETRILVYLKSKVKDAVKNWENMKEALHESLKKQNGIGLPARYNLEADPNNWDFYDLFVLGYYWSNSEYFGQKSPRMAQRAKRYPGTALGLIDRTFELNAREEDILKMNSEPILDMFEWEAIFFKNNLYQGEMCKSEWSGSDLWKAFQENKIFLSYLTQLDCFFLHGLGTEAMPGFLKDPDDMGVARMPQGCSFGLKPDGTYLREGKRAITTGGWWWGIPQDAPHPDLSIKLARYITSQEKQLESCSNFGMVPVRQDILSDLSLMFGQGWISKVFQTSFTQLVENKYTTIPLIQEYDQIGKNYIEAWYDICVNKNFGKDGNVSRQHINQVLNAKYVKTAKAILKNNYPE